MSKTNPPPLQTGNRHQRRTGTFDDSNLLIVNAWHKEEQKRHAKKRERQQAAKGASNEH